MVKRGSKISKSKNKSFSKIISFAIIVLVLAGLYLLFRAGPLFSPEGSVSGFLDQVSISPLNYNIVISDYASSSEISTISNIAYSFGIAGDAFRESEVTYLNNNIVIGQFDFVDLPYGDLIGTNDAIIYYDLETNSLFVYSSDLNGLSEAVSVLSNYLNYPQMYEDYAFKINDGILEPLFIRDLSISATRTIPEMVYNQLGEVTINVVLSDEVDELIVGEIVPAGFEVSNIYPTPILDGSIENVISWDSQNVLAGEYTYSYSINPLADYGEIQGRVGVRIGTQLSDVLTGGDSALSTIVSGPVCVEDWECEPWSECSSGGERTTQCYDMNMCGTSFEKPAEYEACSPSCSETGDEGIDIFSPGKVESAEGSYYDVCGIGTITEYACGESGVESYSYPCYECVDDFDGAYCVKEYSCSSGENKDYVCADGSLKIGACDCVDHDWICRIDLCSITGGSISDTLEEISVNNNPETFKIVIGRDASASDSIGAIELAGKYKISQTVVDDAVIGDTDNLIIVGGPAVNRYAAEFVGVDYPSYGLDSTIPFEKAIVRIKQSGSQKQILVAGWESVNTRNAIKALRDNLGGFNSEQVIVEGNEIGNYQIL